MTKEDMAEIMALFAPVLGADLALDIIKHRKAKKSELTVRGAKSLLKEYQLTGNPVAAAEEHLNRAWVGFKSDWVMKGRNFTDPHNPMPKSETAEERNRRLHLEDEMRWARNEGDTSKQARLKALLEQAVRH